MNKSVDVDDVCGVCQLTRDAHGDKNHEFNVEGQLITLKPGAPPANTPPALREEVVKQLSSDQTTKAFLRLIETLQKKDILSFEDMPFILGGFNANSSDTTQSS